MGQLLASLTGEFVSNETTVAVVLKNVEKWPLLQQKAAAKLRGRYDRNRNQMEGTEDPKL